MSRRLWIWGIIAAGLVAAGLGRLRLDTNVLGLLPPDLPTVRAIDLHQRRFAGSHDLLVTLRGEDPAALEAAARSLAEAFRARPGLVARAVWTPPWEERPDLAAELAATAWLNQPPPEVARLLSRLQAPALAEGLEATRTQLATSFSPADLARASYDPLGLTRIPGLPGLDRGSGPRFVGEEGRFRLILVSPAGGPRGYQGEMAWLREIRKLVDAWRSEDPARALPRIRFTGGPAFTAEIAQGMERDMRGSVAGTALVIAALFGWAHRRLRPLLMLLVLLVVILAATLAAAGFIFGRINSVSLGFAAILLGLAVDYALVLYQEAAVSPGTAPAAIRRSTGPGILAAAFTTAAAFSTLTLAGLPGLTQMGALVAIGTLLSALVMLRFFPLPIDLGVRARPSSEPSATGRRRHRGPTLLLLAGAAGLLAARGFPGIDHTAAPLRPRHSEAYAALDEVKARLGGGAADPWWLIVGDRGEAGVAARLRQAEQILARTRDPQGQPVAVAELPTALWPDPERQAQNRGPLAGLARERDRLRAALRSAGFTDDAFRSADTMLEAWENAARSTTAFWPTNEVSQWVWSQVSARADGETLALGLLQPRPGADAAPLLEGLRQAGLLVGGWDLLGEELLARVEGRLPVVLLPMALLWIGSLALAFRAARDVALAVAALGFGLLLLLTAMAAVGWTWNLMNLMALPLLVGVGTDYAIHMQLALRRHHGNLGAVQRSTGRALRLCAATTFTGFGSLAWSGNAGLASLGAVCATGIACAYVSACHLLPAWWQPPAAAASAGAPTAPSSLYGARGWRLGLWFARRVPRPLLRSFAAAGALCYAVLAPRRRRVVVDNLLPVLDERGPLARRTAWRTFAAFGRKLADLWRYEAGHRVEELFDSFTGWEHLEAARREGRGVLLLTLHLGNWEFGAPLLAARGVPLVVITLAEPGAGLTELRQAARARRGIETLVIGRDPFAFVEVIRRLQAGATIALLVDRPPPPSAVEVEFLGRPFAASIAGAELARATGCVLLPVTLPAVGSRYAAHVLPPVPYDRRALGGRDARRRLTQDILRAFEPPLRQHPGQWFHFVPVWPASPCSADAPPPPSSAPSSAP